MARELVYTGFMSLDGVVDSPGGTAEGHRSGGLVELHDDVVELVVKQGVALVVVHAFVGFGVERYLNVGKLF